MNGGGFLKTTDKLQIIRYVVGPIETNMYLVHNEKEGIIIDPGFSREETEGLVNDILKKCKKISAIMLTHGHYDHISGLPFLRSKIDARIYCHKEDTDKLTDIEKNGAAQFFSNVPPGIKADNPVNDGQMLNFIGNTFTIIHTPGHTMGSVSIHLNDALFCGDTIFRDGIGRTDLYDGDYNTEIASNKKKIMVLPVETRLFPGHGPATTVKRESRHFND